MSQLRRVILADSGHRSVGGDLLLNFPLFYGQTESYRWGTLGSCLVAVHTCLAVLCGYDLQFWRMCCILPPSCCCRVHELEGGDTEPVKIFIHKDDWFCRVSVANLHRFVCDLGRLDGYTDKAKNEIILHGGPEVARALDRGPDASPECPHPKLYHAGQVYYHRDEGDVVAITRDCNARVFQEVLVSWDMFLDHVPSLYTQFTRKLQTAAAHLPPDGGVAQDVSAAAFFEITPPTPTWTPTASAVY